MAQAPDNIPPEVRNQATEWLFALRAAPDDRELRRDIADWVAKNASHARAWQVAEKAWRIAGDLVFDDELYRNIPRQRVPRPPVQKPSAASRKFRFPVFAGGVIAAVLLFFAAPEIQRAISADYQTRTAELRDVALEDGSIVRLAPESAIAIDFQRDSRQLSLLRGEAFFKVMRDTARPFAVSAGPLQVTVTGTEFDVSMSADMFTVSVASGAVRVDYGADARNNSHSLVPGQRLVIDRQTNQATLATIPEAEVASWRNGQIVFCEASMAEAVSTLSRYHFGAFVFTDEELKARRVTGVFNPKEPVNALKLMTAAYGGRVREITPFLVVLSSN